MPELAKSEGMLETALVRDGPALVDGLARPPDEAAVRVREGVA